MTRRGSQIVKGGWPHHARLPVKQTGNRPKYKRESDRSTVMKPSEAGGLSRSHRTNQNGCRRGRSSAAANGAGDR